MMPARTPSSKTPDLRGARVVVAGAAKSGVALARFLLSRGAKVTISDKRQARDLGPEVAALGQEGAAFEFGRHDEKTFSSADLVTVSPGVPLTMAPVASARKAGVRVVAEVEVASWFLEGTLVGITGSNGKSTTTSLAGHILSHAGRNAIACGNLGTPLIEMVEDDSPDRLYIVELSSFQLEGIETFRPHIAVLLNLSPDHQDRYPDMPAYYAAKARIFMNQAASDHAILNQDDPQAMALTRGIAARRHQFSRGGGVQEGAYVRDGRDIILVENSRPTAVMPLSDIPLFGVHNQENVLAAVLAARLCGITVEQAAEGVRSFHGLPHRLEKVRELDGVAWFNDSKATNVGAVAPSVRSFPGGIVLIMGGKDKGGAFADLEPLIRERVTTLVLIGQARASIAKQLGPIVPTLVVEGLEEAIPAARAAAAPGGVVLLAPGCASFDQYSGFEARGDHFRRLVNALVGA
ncbi:MAG TPA: UDP-N-acetylmuramoyl-L-alanine--D-glutamate ligase [Candidatus Polarisedimenticolia bacterium]|nr:UDP-N-acetylmuramoyl-L-alanine--D-glutamate ligase [Candidatus Polarisedimenticolia bacterium]